jgi:hypothetical protein
MSSTIARRVSTSVAVAAVAVGAAVAPANAQDSGYPSCPGFNVGVTLESEAGNPDIEGLPRAVLLAGTSTYTLENMETGTTISVRTAGATRSSPGPGGSTNYTTTGPNILLPFPTDPEGPASTLYRGRVVINQSVDLEPVTTVIASSGGTVDLCAALGG